MQLSGVAEALSADLAFAGLDSAWELVLEWVELWAVSVFCFESASFAEAHRVAAAEAVAGLGLVVSAAVVAFVP